MNRRDDSSSGVGGRPYPSKKRSAHAIVSRWTWACALGRGRITFRKQCRQPDIRVVTTAQRRRYGARTSGPNRSGLVARAFREVG